MLNSYINARINYLEKICSEKEHALHGAPEGILRGIRHGNGFQYFLRAETADHSGTYIKADNRNLLKSSARKNMISESSRLREMSSKF